MRFHFTIAHVPGKDLVIADMLSRAPVSEPTTKDRTLQHETEAFIDLVLSNLPATEERLKEVRKHQKNDEECQQISEFCHSGWPEPHLLSAALKPYSPLAGEFSVQNDLLLRGGQIVIPRKLRTT